MMMLLASIYLIIGLAIIGFMFSVVSFQMLTTMNKLFFVGIALLFALTWPLTVTAVIIMNLDLLTEENLDKAKEKIRELWGQK